MKLDQTAHQVEKIIEKIKSLNHKFSNSVLEGDAESERDAAIDSLESFLELCTEDSENKEEEVE